MVRESVAVSFRASFTQDAAAAQDWRRPVVRALGVRAQSGEAERAAFCAGSGASLLRDRMCRPARSAHCAVSRVSAKVNDLSHRRRKRHNEGEIMRLVGRVHDGECDGLENYKVGKSDATERSLCNIDRRSLLNALTKGSLAACFGAGIYCAHTQMRVFAAEYDEYAAAYDRLDGGAPAAFLGFEALRSRLLARARGRVLELAVGTGLNLPLYHFTDGVEPSKRGSVDSVLGVDISQGMLAQAQTRLERDPFLAVHVSLVRADVTQLGQDSSALAASRGTFDTILDTYSLCVIDDVGAVLDGARRLIAERESSRLLLLEHVAADGSAPPARALRFYQDASAPLVRRLAKGCAWNQRLVDAVRAAPTWQLIRVDLALAGTVALIEARPI